MTRADWDDEYLTALKWIDAVIANSDTPKAKTIIFTREELAKVIANWRTDSVRARETGDQDAG